MTKAKASGLQVIKEPLLRIDAISGGGVVTGLSFIDRGSFVLGSLPADITSGNADLNEIETIFVSRVGVG